MSCAVAESNSVAVTGVTEAVGVDDLSVVVVRDGSYRDCLSGAVECDAGAVERAGRLESPSRVRLSGRGRVAESVRVVCSELGKEGREARGGATALILGLNDKLSVSSSSDMVNGVVGWDWNQITMVCDVKDQLQLLCAMVTTQAKRGQWMKRSVAVRNRQTHKLYNKKCVEYVRAVADAVRRRC